MWFKRFLRFVIVKQNPSLVLAIMAFVSAAIFAQPPTPKPTATPPDDGEVIKIDSRLVIVPVSVTDSLGQPVLGLKAQDFQVLEENRVQEIAQVSDAEKVPLEIALLFDVSASTDAMFQFQLDTASQFLREVMRPEDRATIFTIGARPVLVQARETGEKSSVAVKNIQATKQFTAFYDTVSSASDYLQKNTPPGRRKVILVISDGEDTNSVRIAKAIEAGYRKLGKNIDTIDNKTLYQYTVKARNDASIAEQNFVVRGIQNADTVFYSINPAGSSYQLNQMSQFGQSNLQKFADETGGTAFLPKFAPIDLKDKLQNSFNARKNQEVLSKIFKQLANELQAQYLVQYYSESDFPTNKYVKLKVGLSSSKNYKLRARQGYFVK
jgi:Ca-activated chloride channel family protein